ncbi:hypothetical protein ASD67_10720 [Sphingopyxis sp. Root1497]|nr:hypothetical protein ASD67_10720 [Sphingopyxis sp. Root1497]
MYLHRSFQDIGEAVQHTHDFVADRLLRNGCGDGLIYDQEIGRIISIFGHAQRPKPGSEAPVVEIQASLSHDRMVEVETAFLPWRDWGGDLDAAPTFVWQTLF